MRHTVYTLSALLVFSLACRAEGQVFNPISSPPDSTVQPAGGVSAPTDGEVEQATHSGFPLPKITLPKITMPKVTMPKMDSITGPVKSGFGKVSDGTKKAWEGTKEMLSFGNKPTGSSPQVASAEKTPFWKRMIVRESEPQVPQTVGEFMSQPRLNP